MKLSKIIIFAATTLVMGNAHAATKCVALDSSTTCTSSPEAYKADWSASRTTNGATTPIRGIAFCSNQNGGEQYAKAPSITTSDTVTANIYCWCKMVSPAVSPWVFYVGTSASDCAHNCTYRCAYVAQRDSAFRSALFSELGD